MTAQEHSVNLDSGEQRSEAFLKINPLGAIPALVEKGHAPLTQSVAILEFLNEVTPEPPLLPADPYGRARVRSIAAALAADTHPLIVPRVKKYLTTTGGFDDAAWRAWQINWFTTRPQGGRGATCHRHGHRHVLHGDSVTIADICLAEHYRRDEDLQDLRQRPAHRSNGSSRVAKDSRPLPAPIRSSRQVRLRAEAEKAKRARTRFDLRA